ncbi:MAG TPA: sugar phosphate isomerase/epimerase family protein [Euzebyales bacterium]|nr:sugar phosphate isomerase/epimerase family protein [Euzebyales bacterium]
MTATATNPLGLDGTGGHNALGVHALVWVAGWSPEQCRRAVAATAACGYDLLEIPLLDPAEVDPQMTVAALQGHDLQATCSLGLAFDTDVSSTDTATVERGRRLLLDAVAVAADIGSVYVGGPIYSAMDKYRRPATAAGRANAVAALRSVAEAARERGVTLGFEPVNRYESNLLNTAGQALDLIDDIGADNIVVHLDSYHMHIEERDMASPVRRCAAAGRLGYVHVGESHRGHLGTGSLDLPGLFRALVDTGYGGPIVFESFSSAVVSPAFAAALAVWRDLWTDSTELARSAHRHMRAQLAAARTARAGT